MIIKVKRKNGGVELPYYATKGAAGFDLHADSFIRLYKGLQEISLDDNLQHSIQKGYMVLRPFERVLIGTGLFMDIPEGYQLEIRDRSGLALKKGLKVFNSPGTVDSDYRGEIGIILCNMTQSLSKVSIGERIAQGVLTQYEVASFLIVDKLDDTDRSFNGFGSTGVL
jgi:dUTP pyrophosphatase